MRVMAFSMGLFVAMSVSTAEAQQDVDVTALQMKACTLIKDEAARVRCYDHAMSRPASEPAMVGIGSEAPLVTIPQSSSPAPLVTIPQSSSPTIPQSPSSTTYDLPTAVPVAAPAAAPAAPKSESSSTFDFSTIIRAITPSTNTAPTQPAVDKIDNWQVKADKPELQQASRLTATLKSEDAKATLVFQCKDSSTEARVTTFSFLGWENPRVLYGVNNNPMTESRWLISSEGRSAIASNAIDFINSLGEGGTLQVRLIDYNEINHDLRFDMGAISNLRSQIATICRWPGAVPELASEQAPSKSRSAKPKPKAVSSPLQPR